MTDWLTIIILCTLTVTGLTMRVRRKARERAARLDPCDVIAWHEGRRHEAERKGQAR